MADEAPRPHRCGLVAVVGRPNVGKSTLVNRLIGQKISITSSRPQTTRHRIAGIRTWEGSQVVYLDTPGIHVGPRRALNRALNRTAAQALHGVDLVLLVVEAMRWTDGDERVLAHAVEEGGALLLVVNKVDRVADKRRLLPYLAEVSGRGEFAEIVPVSARHGTSVDRLESLVLERLPAGEAMFDADAVTDRSEAFLAAEVVREKLIRRLGQELPHRLSVEVERFEESGNLLSLDAVILVERSGQKAIVIGKGGQVLKAAGIDARRDLERLFGCRVRLSTFVKVRAGWSDDERALKGMGLVD